jgi:hypothetical protein
LYYGAIVGGMFKDSLLAQFRKYGEENRVYPICRLLFAAGATSLVLAVLLPYISGSATYIQRLFPRSIFVLLTLMFWGLSYLINKRPILRESLPRWYFDLLRTTSRQERRHVGTAWLRLPLMMRLRLNGDQKAFQTWVELVRLTVIYGAHDPDSPWDVWT